MIFLFLLFLDMSAAIMSCSSAPYTTYPTLRMLFNIIEKNNFGYPPRYHTHLEHAMKMVYLFMRAAYICNPIFILVTQLYDCYSSHSFFEMTVLQVALLAFWTFNLVIGMRQISILTFLVIQHALFINLHFKNYFVYLKRRLTSVLKRVFKFKKSKVIKSSEAAKIRQYNQKLAKITIQFVQMQTKVKFLNFIIFTSTMITLEFNIFIIFDNSSSFFIRSIILLEIPFILLFIFLIFNLMTELNSRSKSILPQLDGCLHTVCWSKKAVLRQKISISEMRSLIAEDGVAVNLADIHQLTKAVLGGLFLRMICDIFLLIDFNR